MHLAAKLKKNRGFSTVLAVLHLTANYSLVLMLATFDQAELPPLFHARTRK